MLLMRQGGTLDRTVDGEKGRKKGWMRVPPCKVSQCLLDNRHTVKSRQVFDFDYSDHSYPPEKV